MIRFLLAVALAAAPASAATWTIDSAHSVARFAVKHLMVNTVQGQFRNVTGTVVYDPANPAASKVEATVDASTVDTKQQKRDAHLKSADFFDVAKFPTMHFASKRVIPSGPGKLKLLGDLTIHGVTKEIVFDVDAPTAEEKQAGGGARSSALATARIRRSDFGLTWNKLTETGGVVVSDEVAITLNVELTRK